MPSEVYLVTGGARSGKSNYAQTLCESLSPSPIYLATSKPDVWDDDFQKRVERHRLDRGERWTTIEEPFRPSLHAEQFKGRVIMVDCLTLWLTNYMIREGAFTSPSDGQESKPTEDTSAPERALQSLQSEFDAMTEQWDATFVFVTNEIGSGTHAENQMSRMFVDAQGWLNQHVGGRADWVVHVVCGIPTVLKEPGLDRRAPVPCKRDAKMLDRYLSKRGLQMDAKGYFLMKLDREKGVITAQFYSSILNDKGEVCDSKGNKIRCSDKNRPEPMKTFEGRTAKELTVEIFEKWDEAKDVIGLLSHAAYIGREAQKAEYCLYSGEHFQQN